jgi:hypothetical protein
MVLPGSSGARAPQRFRHREIEVDLDFVTSKANQPRSVMLRKLDDESVLLNLDSGRYYGLDEVGTHLYELLTSSHSLEAALKLALDEYDVDEVTLRADTAALLARLVEEGLIEICDADAGL